MPTMTVTLAGYLASVRAERTARRARSGRSREGRTMAIFNGSPYESIDELFGDDANEAIAADDKVTFIVPLLSPFGPAEEVGKVTKVGCGVAHAGSLSAALWFANPLRA